MGTCTYKYSSNYLKNDLLDLISYEESVNVENCLTNECNRINNCLSGLYQELHIYKIYLKRFPILTELIMKVINRKEAEIQSLKCELNVLRSLIEAC